MAVNFKDLHFAEFSFIIQAIQPLWLPVFKGSTFRGAFGNTFKSLVCVTREKYCEVCIKRNDCIYSYLFRCINPGTHEVFQNSPYIPSPFVLEPPEDKKEHFIAGDILTFRLMLVGKAINYLPQFILTFREMGLHKGIGKKRHLKMGRFLLQEVKTNEIPIYSATTRLVNNNFKTIKWEDLQTNEDYFNSDKLIIEFKTPARIKHKKRYFGKDNNKDRLTFQLFIENLYRRIFMLTFFHCGENNFNYEIPNTDNIRVESSNLIWCDWERYSTYQEERLKLGGVIGDLIYHGDWTTWLNLIKAGEYLHIGKATTFGLGKYVIKKPDSN